MQVVELTEVFLGYGGTHVWDNLRYFMHVFHSERDLIESYFFKKNTFYAPLWAMMEDLDNEARQNYGHKVQNLTLDDLYWFGANCIQDITEALPNLRRIDLELPAGGFTGYYMGKLWDAEKGGFDLNNPDDLRQLESNHLLDAFDKIMEHAPLIRKVKIIVVLPTLERIDNYHPGFPEYLRVIEEEFTDAIEKR